MVVDLGVPGSLRGEVGRRIKEAFDRLDYVDSGWWYVDFDHPVFGRDGGSTAERIEGELLDSTEQPGAEADVLIVAAGFEDPYTGEAHLGNNFTVPAAPERERNPRDEESENYPDQRLPAIALFEEGGKLKALPGTIHSTREARFERAGAWPELVAALSEWAQLAAREAGQKRS